MRIIMASMPLLALAAIFSASALKHIDHAAQVAANTETRALPGCDVIMARVYANKEIGNSRPARKIRLHD